MRGKRVSTTSSTFRLELKTQALFQTLIPLQYEHTQASKKSGKANREKRGGRSINTYLRVFHMFNVGSGMWKCLHGCCGLLMASSPANHSSWRRARTYGTTGVSVPSSTIQELGRNFYVPTVGLSQTLRQMLKIL